MRNQREFPVTFLTRGTDDLGGCGRALAGRTGSFPMSISLVIRWLIADVASCAMASAMASAMPGRPSLVLPIVSDLLGEIHSFPLPWHNIEEDS